MSTGTIAAGPAPGGPDPGGLTRRAGTAGIPASVTPAGAQAVFRAVLDALARPGTVNRLPSAAGEPLAAHVPAVLLPLLALADRSTPACVVSDEAGTWDEVVRVATSAPPAALADARLAAALRPLTFGELAGLRTGTAAAPEDGALACLAVAGIAIVDGVDCVDAADVAGVGDGPDGPDGSGGDGVSDGEGGPDGDCDIATGDGGRLWLRLSGPGVPATRAIIVTGLPAGFTAARRRLVAGFPAGADLLLIAPDGAMTGLPRTTTLQEVASR
jgi:alpha-D-ribose 1-methylphosphonate 5-triphosphate synthase subunit PhnH